MPQAGKAGVLIRFALCRLIKKSAASLENSIVFLETPLYGFAVRLRRLKFLEVHFCCCMIYNMSNVEI